MNIFYKLRRFFKTLIGDEDKLIMLKAFIVVFAMGCSSSPSLTPTEKVARYLPPTATNIKEMGNNWFYFECAVEKPRKFICKVNHVSHGSTVVSITELKE